MKFRIEIDLNKFDPGIAGFDIERIIGEVLRDVSYSADWSKSFECAIEDICGNVVGRLAVE